MPITAHEELSLITKLINTIILEYNIILKDIYFLHITKAKYLSQNADDPS